MKNKKMSIGKIIQFCAIGLLGAATITANVILNVPLPGGNNLSALITNYLYGSGVNYDNETFQQAVAQSKDLNLDLTLAKSQKRMIFKDSLINRLNF